MPGYVLTIVNIRTRDWCVPILETSQIIGRGLSAQIRVPDGHLTVSRQHASIWLDRSGLWICDLKSTSGTTINGVTLIPERATKLNEKDRIMIGELLMTVRRSSPAPGEVDDGDPLDWSDESTVTRKRSGHTLETVTGFPLDRLTPAEREVVLWMARGHSSLESLSEKLVRSPNTVRTQINNIFRKLDIHSRDALLGYLVQLDLDNLAG